MVQSLANYSDSNFFGTGPGAVAFKTPDRGVVTTAHASHPRTELRETSVPDWRVDQGSHSLRAQLTVMRVSGQGVRDAKSTIVAQVHGNSLDERAKLLKVLWRGLRPDSEGAARGQLEARVKNATAPFDEFGMVLGTWNQGVVLQLKVVVERGGLTVTASDGMIPKTIHHRPPMPSDADTFYFKAGNYNQCNATCDAGQDDYAEVWFLELATTHTKS